MTNTNFKTKFIYISCLVLLYISWGSAYLLNKLSLEYYPPIYMAGIRISIAGAILLIYSYITNDRTKINAHEIKRALILAIPLVLMASGFLCIGQVDVPSGTSAIIYGSAPVFLLVCGWLFAGEKKPTNLQFLGLFLGLAMIFWIKIHQGSQGEASYFGLFMVITAVAGWVIGSILSRKKPFHSKLSVIRSSGVIMFLGGLETILLAIIMNENLEAKVLSFNAIFLMMLSILFVAILGFTCYMWLLVNARPIVAISYEFVTPIIAVFLGWLLANENISLTIILACIGLVVSIFLSVSKDR